MGNIELRRMLENGRYYEAPRWHSGRLWFVDCLARTLLSIGARGNPGEIGIERQPAIGVGEQALLKPSMT
jgi:hypothetical protein